MGLFHFKQKVDAIQKDIAAQQVGPAPAEPMPSTEPLTPVDAMPPTAPPPVQTSEPQMVPPAPVATPSSSEPFALPDLPPMPDFADNATIPQPEDVTPAPVEEEPVGEQKSTFDALPELPELPSFENHPEYELLDELADDEMIPVNDSVDDSQLGKPFEDTLIEPEVAPVVHVPFSDAPIFLDVEEYQDVLCDINITKSDLKHIHDRSELAEHESRIDTTLDQFKKNILQAKKQLNHVDELLFMR